MRGCVVSFSVVIPAYNSEKYIALTLESILDQDCLPAEIIVVNDQSSDSTVEIVRSFGGSVKLLSINNMGTSGARHFGASYAIGEYLAFCDHDDIWQPDHLSRLKWLIQNTHAQIVFSNFCHVRDGSRMRQSHFESDPTGFWKNPGNSLGCDFYHVRDKALYDQIINYQVIFPSCMAIRKELYENLGGYDPSFGRNVSEDLEFTLRWACGAVSVGIDVKATVDVIRHGSNYSTDWIRGLKDSIEILKYSKENHNLSAELVKFVDLEIIRRCNYAIDSAFLNWRTAYIEYFAKEIG
jgi:glycosyltransferase involved in cell wall biosynthesis